MEMQCDNCGEEFDFEDLYDGLDGELLCYACYKEAKYLNDALSEYDSHERG